MSKILANQIANYGDDAPIELKEGLNIPAGKPIQAAGSSGSSGQVLSTTGTSIAWVAVFDGDYNSLSNKPSIPAAQVPSDWDAAGGVSRILNKPIIPAQPSVTTATAGTPALSYNTVNGEFTYTPPDLSNYDTAFGWGDHASAGYLTSLGDAAGVTTAKINNWDTAFGWGDHSSAGYLTSYSETSTFQNVIDRGNTCTSPVYVTNKLYFSNNFATLTDLQAVNATTYHGMFAHVHAEGHGYFAHAGAWTQLVDTSSSIDELGDVDLSSAPSDGHVLKWEASSSSWKAQPDLVGSGGSGIVLADLSVNTAAASATPSLSYSNTTGVFTYTPYDPSTYTETDPVFLASASAGITSSNIANWDAAYGWGNHASAGYLTAVSLSLTGLTDVSITPANLTSGDSIVWNGTQWTRTTQQFITSTPEITQNDSKAEVIGVGSDDGEFKVTLQDSTSGGAGATALRVHTDSSVNVIEFNEGNPAAKSRLVLNHLTTTNAWSEIHFKRTGASPGTSMIRSGGGGSGGYFQFYPVDGNVDFQVSGTGTYTRLNAIVDGSLTAGGLTYPSDLGTSGDVLTSDGAGNVTWQTPTGGGGGGANVTISDTIPAGTPAAGDLWWESDKGRLKVYYTDTNSSQWVDVNPPLAPALSSDAPVTASSAGSVGDIRYDSGYVYICVATNTWKRAALATW